MGHEQSTNQSVTADSALLDSEVSLPKKSKPRRQFSDSYKRQILDELEACPDGPARGALLRKEGLHYSRITSWKQQFSNGAKSSFDAQRSIR